MGMHKTLLAVEVFRMTGKQIYNIKQKYLNETRFYTEILPQYCLSEKGYIKDSEYLGWMDKDDKKEYILFNTQSADRLLEAEIQNVGLDKLLEEQDLRNVFAKIPGISYEDFYSRERPASYLVIGIEYWGHGEDFETASSVIGYMLDDLNFKDIAIFEEVY